MPMVLNLTGFSFNQQKCKNNWFENKVALLKFVFYIYFYILVIACKDIFN